MSVTIIQPENTVIVNGAGLRIDCSSLEPMINVVQWDDELNLGHIEFVNTPGNPWLRNVNITNFDEYEIFRTAWNNKQAEIAVAAQAVVAAEQDSVQVQTTAPTPADFQAIMASDTTIDEKAAAITELSTQYNFRISAANDVVRTVYAAYRNIIDTPGPVSP